MSRILVPIALLISSIGLYFSYISPNLDSLQQYKQIETRLVKARDDFEIFKGRRGTISQQYEAMRKTDLDRLKQMLPDSVDAVQTIIDIDNLASSNNISIDSFDLPVPGVQSSTQATDPLGTPPAFYGTEQFSVTLVGSYQNFKNFMSGIESNLTLMDITKLGIDATGGEEIGTGDYLFHLTFTTYRLQ